MINNELFEPAKQNRFIIKFKEGYALSAIPSYCIYKVSELHRLNYSVDSYYKGVDSFTSFELYNPLSICIPSIIEDALKDDASVKAEINILNAVGDVVYTWEILGKIDTVTYGGLSWYSDELNVTKITIRHKDTDIKLIVP